MMNNKPTILLTQEKMRELIALAQAGDKFARQQMIEGNKGWFGPSFNVLPLGEQI